jgi:hypothetical protein
VADLQEPLAELSGLADSLNGITDLLGILRQPLRLILIGLAVLLAWGLVTFAAVRLAVGRPLVVRR